MREQYRAPDAVPAGAWTWAAPWGQTFVLVLVQSTLPGVVQARAELWLADDGAVILLGRSDAMPSVAELGAFAFEDLTGDGLPDFLGYVADSAGVAYPVFVRGARGQMSDELEQAASGWRFAVDAEHAPRVVMGPHGACALQLWAEEPANGGEAGAWRYLPLLASERLGAPAALPPDCP